MLTAEGRPQSGGPESGRPGLPDKEPKGIIDHDREDQDAKRIGISPCIKKNARRQEQQVFRPLRGDVVEHENQRQEQKQENWRTKGQPSPSTEYLRRVSFRIVRREGRAGAPATLHLGASR